MFYSLNIFDVLYQVLLQAYPEAATDVMDKLTAIVSSSDDSNTLDDKLHAIQMMIFLTKSKEFTYSVRSNERSMKQLQLKSNEIVEATENSSSLRTSAGMLAVQVKVLLGFD